MHEEEDKCIHSFSGYTSGETYNSKNAGRGGRIILNYNLKK
jgi:hypothetical protein